MRSGRRLLESDRHATALRLAQRLLGFLIQLCSLPNLLPGIEQHGIGLTSKAFRLGTIASALDRKRDGAEEQNRGDDDGDILAHGDNSLP